jgi:D-alanyl-lipoteichoic acid acyltransferase DltB (MBOAT superfamily)
MKQFIKLYLLISFGACLIIHLLFAYGNWSFNPGDWRGVIRTLAVLLFFSVLIFTGFLVDFIITQQNKLKRNESKD